MNKTLADSDGFDESAFSEKRVTELNLHQIQKNVTKIKSSGLNTLPTLHHHFRQGFLEYYPRLDL